MWLAIAAYAVFATLYARERRAEIAVERVDIEVAQNRAMTIATPDSVRRWLAEGGFAVLGSPIDNVDTRAIERFLESYDGIRDVRVRTDLSGNLTIKVEQRRPLFRVETAAGQRFWVTRERWILPDGRGFPHGDTMVVRGEVPVGFDPAVSVDYASLLRQNFDYFLQEFTALDGERKQLTAERSALRDELRAAERSGPKRFWGRLKREGFERRKAERIDALRSELRNADVGIENNASKWTSTLENEIFSQQTLDFIPKLANFVEFVVDSEFWASRVTAVGVVAGELYLVPRTGGRTIVFGELDGTEYDKMHKLEAFWRSGEMEKYRTIDVKYKDQIVCRVN